MKKTIAVIALCALFLAACEEDSRSAKDASKEMASSGLAVQNENLQAQVKLLEQQLKETQQENETGNKEPEGTEASSFGSLYRLYPELAFLNAQQSYTKIQLKYEKGAKEITDPAILQSLEAFVRIQTELQLGSGPQADIEPVQYVLSTANSSVTMNIVELGVAAFPDLYPDKYFQINNDAYQLAKAFMDRPDYLGEESAGSKIVQSGLLNIQNDREYVIYNAGRIRSVALAYVHADKHEIAAPKNSLPSILQLTFYYYGERIQLNLYEGVIQQVDNSNEKWFAVDQDDLDQLQAKISAS